MKKLTALVCLVLLLSLPCSMLAEEEFTALHADFLENADQAAFSQFVQLTLDPDSNEVSLFTEKTLSNFTIDFGLVDFDGVNFIPEYTLFYAKEFTPDMLLVINTYFTDTVPTLRIRYLEDDQETERFLFQSGEDGSILLLPALF